MSDKNYEQCFCRQGHYFILKANQIAFCPYCGQPVEWSHLVDNSGGDRRGHIHDHAFSKFLISGEKQEKCSLGFWHVTQVAVYRIPNQDETKMLSSVTY